MLVDRRALIVSCLLSVLALVALQVFTTTPLYRSTTVLQVNPEDQNVLPYEEIVDSHRGQNSGEEYLWTQAEKLETRGLARRVIEAEGLMTDETFLAKPSRGVMIEIATLPVRFRSTDPQSIEAAIDTLLENLLVTPVRNTRLIEVAYRSTDPEFSARVANRWAEEFIAQHVESKFDATTRAASFLEQQLFDLKSKVERSEEEILRYGREADIVNLGEQLTINRKTLADMNDQLTVAQADLIALRARYQAAMNASEDEFPDPLQTASMRQVEESVSSVRQQLAALSDSYGPEWPAVRELLSRKEELEQQLEAERRRVLESARQEYQMAANRHAQFAAALEAQRRTVDQMDEASIQHNILRREVESNKTLYEGLLQRLKEAGVAAGLRSSNIHIADLAEAPLRPASPKPMHALALALLVGGFIGVAGAFLVEGLDNTVKTAEDVTRYVGLPTLGLVPDLTRGSNGGHSWRPWAKPYDEGRPLLAVDEMRVHGRAMEAYRSLRTSILLSHSEHPPQSLLVTSALPNEGKTTTATNVAIALAQTGARTVLIDLDMRTPLVGDLFGMTADAGMSGFLSGNCDLTSQIRGTKISNLYVVPGGAAAPNPAELIGSQRMRTAVQLFTEQFQYVIFDTPPSLELSDALVLSPLIEGVIFVARAGSTPRAAIATTTELFDRVGASTLGVVLNDVDVTESAYGYYGAGASYGEYEEPTGLRLETAEFTTASRDDV